MNGTMELVLSYRCCAPCILEGLLGHNRVPNDSVDGGVSSGLTVTRALRVGLTGTPGTGKTSVTRVLSKIALTRNVSGLADERGFLGLLEPKVGVREIDIDNLVSSLEDEWVTEPDNLTIIEGHLAHHLPCDVVVVLRCDPDILRSRLEKRGYSEKKINDNVEWELMGSMWNEYSKSDVPWTEFDSSFSKASDIAKSIVEWLGSEMSTTQSSMVVDWVSRKEGV